MGESGEYVTDDRYGHEHARDGIHGDAYFKKDIAAGWIFHLVCCLFGHCLGSLSEPGPDRFEEELLVDWFSAIMYPLGRCEASQATTSEMSWSFMTCPGMR